MAPQSYATDNTARWLHYGAALVLLAVTIAIIVSQMKLFAWDISPCIMIPTLIPLMYRPQNPRIGWAIWGCVIFVYAAVIVTALKG